MKKLMILTCLLMIYLSINAQALVIKSEYVWKSEKINNTWEDWKGPVTCDIIKIKLNINSMKFYVENEEVMTFKFINQIKTFKGFDKEYNESFTETWTNATDNKGESLVIKVKNFSPIFHITTTYKNYAIKYQGIIINIK